MIHPGFDMPQNISLVVALFMLLISLYFAVKGIIQLRLLCMKYEKRVDPWELQAELMRISGQEMPPTPRINNGSLMYAALQAEELSEEYEALAVQLRRQYGASASAEPLITRNPTMHGLIVDMMNIAGEMHAISVSMRARLPMLVIDVPLTPAQAKDIFDGTTDVQVVNSGFALASGMPGAAGYLDVQTSNLSKRNPATGVIDKTPDGKWIKGSNYKEPQLIGVLKAATAVPMQ